MVRRPRYWDSPSLSAGPRGQLFSRAAASVALCAQGQGRHPSGAAGARNLLPRRVLGCAGGAQAPPACRLGARAPHACAWSTVVLPARRRPDARAQGARRGGPIKGAAFWQYIHDGQASAPRPRPAQPALQTGWEVQPPFGAAPFSREESGLPPERSGEDKCLPRWRLWRKAAARACTACGARTPCSASCSSLRGRCGRAAPSCAPRVAGSSAADHRKRRMHAAHALLGSRRSGLQSWCM